MASRQSSAMQLIGLVWNHNREATGHSWTRLNQSMSSAVELAISAGLRFDVKDFERIASSMSIGRWCGSDGGERWYNLAIEMNNASAIAAYEQWRSRKPFLIQLDRRSASRTRVHIGLRFRWQNETVRVTSFANDQSHFVACSYKPTPVPNHCEMCGQPALAYYAEKVKRRFKITHDDLRAYHATIRESTDSSLEDADSDTQESNPDKVRG